MKPERCRATGIFSVHVHSHMQARRCLQLAAESSNWVNETLSLLTHVQTHARHCKRTVYTQVSYMRNASVVSEFLFPFADKQRTYWHFTKTSRKLTGISDYFYGLIRLSCIRRHPRVRARYMLIDPIRRSDTFIAGIRVILSWNNVFTLFTIRWRPRLFLARGVHCETREWNTYN